MGNFCMHCMPEGEVQILLRTLTTTHRKIEAQGKMFTYVKLLFRFLYNLQKSNRTKSNDIVRQRSLKGAFSSLFYIFSVNNTSIIWNRSRLCRNFGKRCKNVPLCKPVIF